MAERIRANIDTLDHCIEMLQDISQKAHSTTYPTRSEMHQAWLKEGTVHPRDVDRVTLKKSVSEPSDATMVVTNTSDSRLPTETGLPTIEEHGSNTMRAKSGSATGALSKSKSSRSIRQAARMPEHGQSSPPSEITTRRHPHAKDIGMEALKGRPSDSVASQRTTSHQSDRSRVKGSHPSPPESVHSARDTDGARTKTETTATGSERDPGTAKSASSSRPRVSATSSSEKGSLEKIRSHAARPVSDSAGRGLPSAAPQEKSSSSSPAPIVSSDRLPQVDSLQDSRARPLISRTVGKETPVKGVGLGHSSKDKTARRGPSPSTASVLSIDTSNGVSVAPVPRSATMTSVESTRSTHSSSSHVTRVPSSTTPKITASPLKPLLTSSKAPSVRWKGTSMTKPPVAPLKVEKPQSLAEFAETKDHTASTDFRRLDALTPLVTFFAESVVGSTLDDEDLDDSDILEDSPFGRLKHLRLSRTPPNQMCGRAHP
ncbi:hypothetical protein C8T65DRAFT_120079 [Cerioporus squamosus]|nr:hypothetical protein C8T65DRAFT_120079 [Cerioporus squamosus]